MQTQDSLKELKRKAKAWDNYLAEQEEKERENLKIIFSAAIPMQLDKKMNEIKNKYMEGI